MLYHIELEAVLKEIFTHGFNNVSSRVFTREQYMVWNLTMPFWKKLETMNKPEEPNERSILRDLPPHISARRRQTAFWIPETTNVQADYEDSRTFYPLDFTTDFTNHDTWNIHAQQAEQHIGTQQSIQEKPLSVRQGRLRESIAGLQYFHTGNESYVAPDMCSWSNIQLEPEDLLIYINKNFPVLSPVWVKMIKMLTEEDHPEEILTILTISDCQEGDPPEEDHLEDYWIGSLDIQEEEPPCRNTRNHGNQDDGFRFDLKMKPDDMPTWDGNGDLNLEWLNKINHLAYQNLCFQPIRNHSAAVPHRMHDAMVLCITWHNTMTNSTELGNIQTHNKQSLHESTMVQQNERTNPSHEISAEGSWKQIPNWLFLLQTSHNTRSIPFLCLLKPLWKSWTVHLIIGEF